MSFATAIMVVLASAALAQKPAAVGVLDATSHRVFEPGRAIQVRRPDSTPLTEDIARVFSRELAKRGHAGLGGQYTLSFRFIGEASDDPRASQMIELGGDISGNPTYANEARALRRIRPRKPARPTADAIPSALYVEITDGQGVLVWSARATVGVKVESAYEMASTLIPPLLGRMGTTAFGDILD